MMPPSTALHSVGDCPATASRLQSTPAAPPWAPLLSRVSRVPDLLL